MDDTSPRSGTSAMNQENGPSRPGGPPKRRYKTLVIVLGVFVVWIVGMAVAMLTVTSSTRFCLTCHEMKPYQQELALSPHAKDADGNPIACADCHLPRGVGPRYFAVKTYSGVKDIYTHFVEAPQSLDRRDLQLVARRFIDDASCIRCHDDLYMDAKGKAPISALGRIAHDSYNGLDGKTYRNCAECHVNIAHLPVFDRRLDINKDFAKKLAAQEQKGGAQ